jgi:hypothetical protein
MQSALAGRMTGLQSLMDKAAAKHGFVPRAALTTVLSKLPQLAGPAGPSRTWAAPEPSPAAAALVVQLTEDEVEACLFELDAAFAAQLPAQVLTLALEAAMANRMDEEEDEDEVAEEEAGDDDDGEELSYAREGDVSLLATLPNRALGWPESPLAELGFVAYRASPHFGRHFASLSSLTLSNKIDPQKPFCRYDLTGTCNDAQCPMQHVQRVGLSSRELSQDLATYRAAEAEAQTAGDPCVVARAVLAAPSEWREQAREHRVKASALGASDGRRIGDRGNAHDPSMEVGGGNEARVRELEAAAVRDPTEVAHWLALARATGDTGAEEDAVRRCLRVLARAVSHIPQSEELWSEYVRLYTQHATEPEVRAMTAHAVAYCPFSLPLWTLHIRYQANTSDVTAAVLEGVAAHCQADLRATPLLARNVCEILLLGATRCCNAGSNVKAKNLLDCSLTSATKITTPTTTTSTTTANTKTTTLTDADAVAKDALATIATTTTTTTVTANNSSGSIPPTSTLAPMLAMTAEDQWRMWAARISLEAFNDPAVLCPAPRRLDSEAGLPSLPPTALWVRAWRRQGAKAKAWLERVRGLLLQAHNWFVSVDGPGSSTSVLLVWAAMEAALEKQGSELGVGPSQLLVLVPSAPTLLQATKDFYRYHNHFACPMLLSCCTHFAHTLNKTRTHFAHTLHTLCTHFAHTSHTSCTHLHTLRTHFAHTLHAYFTLCTHRTSLFSTEDVFSLLPAPKSQSQPSTPSSLPEMLDLVATGLDRFGDDAELWLNLAR